MCRTERETSKPRCLHGCSGRQHRCLRNKEHKENCVFACGMSPVRSRTKCQWPSAKESEAWTEKPPREAGTG